MTSLTLAEQYFRFIITESFAEGHLAASDIDGKMKDHENDVHNATVWSTPHCTLWAKAGIETWKMTQKNELKQQCGLTK